jgi:predicted GIY-YIG superfamily endonuclease
VRSFFVYILRCADGSYYVGHTDDLELRMAQHHDGTFGGHTSRRRPVELAWSAELPGRAEALERELQLKRWTRAKKEALIRGDWRRLSRLSRGPDRRAAPFDSAPGARPSSDTGTGRYAQGERITDPAGERIANPAGDERDTGRRTDDA